MITTNRTNFQNDVLNFKGVVVADFYADWCGPCRMLSPMLEELSHNNKNDLVKFVKVNVDENQDLAGTYGVMSIPTVIFFKEGKLTKQLIGVQSPTVYEETINQSLQ